MASTINIVMHMATAIIVVLFCIFASVWTPEQPLPTAMRIQKAQINQPTDVDLGHFGTEATSDVQATKAFNNLADYLTEVRAELESELTEVQAEPTRIHVVMGNEAGDLDSLAGAIAFAALKYAQSEGTEFVIPMYNMPRAEMEMYKDNVEVLKHANISLDSILCKNDLPLKKLNKKNKLSVTLVDHNVLSPTQEFLANAVVGIIDHHNDGKQYDISKENRNIEEPKPEDMEKSGPGSCCTLVWKKLTDAGDIGANLLADTSLSLLLASAVMMDTRNLEDKKKTTVKDADALKTLVRSIPGDSETAWLNLLNEKRGDNKGLSFIQVSLKDLKYSRDTDSKLLFAVGSVKKTARDLADETNTSRENVLRDISAHMKDTDLHSFTATMKNYYTSTDELLVVTQPGCFKQMRDALEKKLWDKSPTATVTGYSADRTGWAHDDDQPMLFAIIKGGGRKTVLPFLQTYFKEFGETLGECAKKGKE